MALECGKKAMHHTPNGPNKLRGLILAAQDRSAMPDHPVLGQLKATNTDAGRIRDHPCTMLITAPVATIGVMAVTASQLLSGS
jgi:hypothetical protein